MITDLMFLKNTSLRFVDTAALLRISLKRASEEVIIPIDIFNRLEWAKEIADYLFEWSSDCIHLGYENDYNLITHFEKFYSSIECISDTSAYLKLDNEFLWAHLDLLINNLKRYRGEILSILRELDSYSKTA